jgi:hypothetical protein
MQAVTCPHCYLPQSITASSMRRAALAALQAARQHAAAAGPTGTTAVHSPQLQQPGHSWSLPLLRCLSTAVGDLNSSRHALGSWQPAGPTCGSPLLRPAANCSPVRLADGRPSPALLHSRQLHVATPASAPAADARPPLEPRTTCSAALSALHSRSRPAPSSQLRRTSAAGSTAASTLRYRAYASRAAQALTKGHAAGPGTQQQVSMRISVASPNQIAEPYT